MQNAINVIAAEQYNGGRKFFFEDQVVLDLTLDDARNLISNKLSIPKNSVVLRFRKDEKEQEKDQDIKVMESYPNGIIKYDIKYQSIVPDMSVSILSKETIDKDKKIAVNKMFPFTKEQKNYIQKHSIQAPKWVIELLYESFTTNNVPDVVRSINKKNQFLKEDFQDEQADQDDYVYLEPLVHYLTQDFEIMTKPMHVVERMK